MSFGASTPTQQSKSPDLMLSLQANQDDSKRISTSKIKSDLKHGVVPEGVDEQIKHVEAVIGLERREGVKYPFTFKDGRQISSAEQSLSDTLKLSPTDIIRAELKLRE